MKNCGDCGAAPGEMHVPGCDVEVCPACGGQFICCDCTRGPDSHDEAAAWMKQWWHRRIPWSGEWPGKKECRELGLWCVRNPDGHCQGYLSVPAGTPGAMEDLNTLHGLTVWDPEAQTWRMK